MYISTSTHPKAQISTGFPQSGDPNNTSGALYHLVATQSVIRFFLLVFNTLEIPKSASFIEQSQLHKIFAGFMSLCTTFAVCIHKIALASYHIINFLCSFLQMSARMTVCKSASSKSYMMYTSLLFLLTRTVTSLIMLG